MIREAEFVGYDPLKLQPEPPEEAVLPAATPPAPPPAISPNRSAI